MRTLLVSVTVVACGAPAVVVTPTLKPSPGPVVTESRARWVLHRAVGLRPWAALDIAGGQLIPAADGQRWLKKGDKLTNADALLPESLVAALPSKSGVELVGASGAVYTTKEPLGPVISTRVADRKLWTATASESAILAIDGERRLHRSTDRGVTFVPVAGAEELGQAYEVHLESSGKGLLAVAPERTFVTADHGATWKLGAAAIPEAEDKWLAAAPPDPVVSIAVHDDVVVAVAHKRGGKPSVAVTTLDGARVYASVPGLDACGRVAAAAAKDHVAVACTHASPREVLVARTFDRGKTWKTSKPYPGAHPLRPFRFAVGPRGSVVYSGEKTIVIEHETAEHTELGLRLVDAAYDEKRARWTLLGDHDGARRVLARTSAGELTTLATLAEEDARLSIGDDVFVATESADVAIARIVEGKAPEWHKYALRNGAPALAGSIGLIATPDGLFETTDGGAHLRRVGPARAPLACSEKGCATADAARIGWDRITDDKTLSANAPKTSAPAEPTAPSPRDVTCTEVGKPEKIRRVTIEVFDHIAPFADRAYRVPTLDGFISGTWAKPALESRTLLGLTGAKAHTVFHTLPNGVIMSRFAVAPKKPGDEALRPLTLQLAWLRNGEKTPRFATVPNFATFWVSVGGLQEARWQDEWISGIVDDGVLLRPVRPRRPSLKYEAPLFFHGDSDLDGEERTVLPELGAPRDLLLFVSNSGKVEKLTPPPTTSRSIIDRIGDRWLVVDPLGSFLEVFVSDDAKATKWSHRSINLWSSEVSVTAVGSGRFAVIPNGGKRGFVIKVPLEGTIEARSFVIGAQPCSGEDPGAFRAVASGSPYAFRVGVEDAVRVEATALRVPENGPACVVAYAGSRYDTDAFFVSAADPKRSIRLHHGLAQSVSCPL